MNKLTATLVVGSLYFLSPMLAQAGQSYGQNLCHSSQYECVRVKPGDSWGSLFRDPDTRMIVKKVNRMNTPLHSGMIIAVPRNLGSINIMSLAPFPAQISPPRSNLIKVDLSKLAWGAYNEQGNLVNWGPASGGRGYCPDIHHGCKTITGSYTFYDKQGEGCISHRFPVPHGGAHMPYCMHFHGGFALHGSAEVPGYNASHGCVRLFTEDAMWLNHNFVEIGSTQVHIAQ